MGNTPRLSISIARQFAAGVYDYDPTSFVEMDDDAAVVLAQCTDELSLDRISSLSPASAKSLARYRGPALFLGLTSLPYGIAALLARYECKSLWLDRLSMISDEAAGALSHYRGDLWLDALLAMSDNAAVALAGHVGILSLDGVNDISQNAAHSLARHRGEVYCRGWPKEALAAYETVRSPLRGVMSFARDPNTFSLADLASITEDQAKVLAETPWYLNLAGITALTDGCAAILAQHVGSLYLGNLSSISPAAMELLLFHNGPIFFNVKKLAASAAAMLGDAKGGRRERRDHC